MVLDGRSLGTEFMAWSTGLSEGEAGYPGFLARVQASCAPVARMELSVMRDIPFLRRGRPRITLRSIRATGVVPGLLQRRVTLGLAFGEGDFGDGDQDFGARL